jgi:2-methylisocitrate lyase-like PEP mutase family enzyme
VSSLLVLLLTAYRSLPAHNITHHGDACHADRRPREVASPQVGKVALAFYGIRFNLSAAEDSMTTQSEKAERFRALHARAGAFVIPNPWDAGSARLLAGLGFEALATTSAGFANSRGRLDGQVTRDDVIEHCRQLSAATDLPVSADLENCFADDPAEAAATIVLAARAGVVGGSIEDYTGDPSNPVYDFSLAVERVHAAAEAVRSLGFPFTLTARAENLLRGRQDLDDTIRRLQAFEAAGADVLYAPGLTTLDEVRQVTGALSKPVNVLAPLLKGATVAQLADAGARRISTGGALARAAVTALLRAGREMLEGSFDWTSDLESSANVSRLLNARP